MAMNYIFAIIAIVFFIFIFPFSLKFHAYFSTEQRRLYYTIKLFTFSLYSGYVYFKDGKLYEHNFLGNNKPINLREFKRPDENVLNISVSIFNRATFNKLNIFAEIGQKDDMFLTTLSSGAVSALIGYIFSRARQKNKIIDLNSYIVQKNNVNIFEITISSTFSVSLFSIVTSLIIDTIKGGIENARKSRNQANGTKQRRKSA